MKVIELLRFSRDMLECMSRNDIRTEDWKDVEMFEEYESLRAKGEKTTWIVAYLSDKYGRSERTIHRVIRRFCCDVTQ